MANRATITYNGKTISTEDREGNFAVTYNGKTLATIAPGNTKTLKCSGKYMLTNVVVGDKTLACAEKQMLADVVVAVVSLFPSEPTSYSLIGTYEASSIFTAPEDGYYQIELHGASGTGGTARSSGTDGIPSAGGGGGGGCAISRIKMKKGDTVTFTLGSPNTSTSYSATYAENSTAVIKSSLETYSALEVTGAANGTNTSGYSTGKGGIGGKGSNGNYANYTGEKGEDGSRVDLEWGITVTGGSGGKAGYSGGNAGGKGEDNALDTIDHNRGYGKKAFIKIYRGNTNLA